MSYLCHCLFIVFAALPCLAWADNPPGGQQVEISAIRDAEWGSYRRAYKASAYFETFIRTRPLIQAHLQLRPVKDVSMEGLSLHLAGEKTSLDIAVDSIGRATIPMLKQAYAEDAVLRLNRPAGLFYFSGRYSIKEHEGGVYDANEMRSACEQLLSAQRESGYRIRLIGKKCAGIKYVYALMDNGVSVSFTDTQKQMHSLPVTDNLPFEDNSMGKYKVATYRFADWPQQGQIITLRKPLAIGTLYE
ncbi:hypothetical protein [Undibacterium sp. TJN19]|uniref:hypothetical protein n=1 Tax=Undibacterium sp. TJN19 TaxID=3413055 RepID=UPI003BF0F15B